MTNQEKSNLLNLIGNGKVQEAIDNLLALEMSESVKKETLAISSRYKKLKQQSRLGILSFEQLNISENQITAHLLDLINQPVDQSFPKEKSINTTNPTRPIIWKYITAFAVVIGILGSLAEVINLIDIFSFNKGNSQLTVFVKDIKGNVVLENEGKLNIPLGNRPLNEPIGNHGRTNFADITSDNIGDTIIIGLDAEGWEIADGINTFVFTGEPISLIVKRDDSLGKIKGVVKSRDGQEFIEGALVHINTDTIVLTNEFGIFNIVELFR